MICLGLNPLKRVNSILTRIEIVKRYLGYSCLNPLKRVNSILTRVGYFRLLSFLIKSQSPQTGQFNSYYYYLFPDDNYCLVVSQSPQTGQFNSYGMGYIL